MVDDDDGGETKNMVQNVVQVHGSGDLSTMLAVECKPFCCPAVFQLGRDLVVEGRAIVVQARMRILAILDQWKANGKQCLEEETGWLVPGLEPVLELAVE